jgi:DNA-binding XRE family transcriptional regulator
MAMTAKAIDGTILRRVREERKLSRPKLAKLAGVDPQTVYRIESEPPKMRHQITINTLCKHLGITEGVLTGDIPSPSPEVDESPIFPRYQLNHRVGAATRNAYSLVAMRYGIPASLIVELAPLLFLTAAEKSLRQRQAKLDGAEGLIASLGDSSADFPHLPRLDFFHHIEALDVERQSITKRDVMGRIVDDASIHSPEEDEDDDVTNPFAAFLSMEAGAGAIDFVHFGSTGFPVYTICRDDALQLTGNDPEAAEAILSGSAQLHELTKEMRAAGTEMVAEWARQKAAEASRALYEALGMDPDGDSSSADANPTDAGLQSGEAE